MEWVCLEAADPAAPLTMPASPSSSLVEPASCKQSACSSRGYTMPCDWRCNATLSQVSSQDSGPLMQLTFPYDPLKICTTSESEQS